MHNVELLLNTQFFFSFPILNFQDEMCEFLWFFLHPKCHVAWVY